MGKKHIAGLMLFSSPNGSESSARKSLSGSPISSDINLGSSTLFISDEVAPCLTSRGNTKDCPGNDPQLDLVDSLDDAWVSSSGCSVEIGAFTDVSNIAFTGATYGVDRHSLNAAALVDSTQIGSATGSGRTLTGAGNTSLQDDAPKPSSLVADAYWNVTTNGSNSERNAVYFDFSSSPIGSGFGAWFGDLETKLHAANYVGVDSATGNTETPASQTGGAEAFVRLFYQDGTNQQIAIPASHAPAMRGDVNVSPRWTQAVPLTGGGDLIYCGGTDPATDANGCGNSTTRFVGFSGPSSPVTGMLVVVGDDDHHLSGPFVNAGDPGSDLVACPTPGIGNGCEGGGERLSFIGASLMNCSLAVTLSYASASRDGAGVHFSWQIGESRGHDGCQ